MGRSVSAYDVDRKLERLEFEVVLPLERTVARLQKRVAELEKERDEQ